MQGESRKVHNPFENFDLRRDLLILPSDTKPEELEDSLRKVLQELEAQGKVIYLDHLHRPAIVRG